MSVLNKNNYGYISPSDFNLYAKQAQLDLFEDYFYQYNYQINKENKRLSGTEYADIKKGIEEVIDTFSETEFLLHNNSNKFFTPSLITTSNDYYLLNKILVYSKLITSGITNAIQVQSLVDANANFLADGVSVGDIVVNVSSNFVGFVSEVDQSNPSIILTLVDVNGNPADLGFLSSNQAYKIYSKNPVKEAEKVTHSKITMLNNSILTSPNLMFPAYSQQDITVSLFPEKINEYGTVQCQYIRFPKVPKWTFVQLTNGEPAFDPSQPDFQDFELPNDDEVNLINRILQYAGMSIRELSVAQFAQTEEQESTTEER